MSKLEVYRDEVVVLGSIPFLNVNTREGRKTNWNI
jgi:hypothetical protein